MAPAAVAWWAGAWGPEPLVLVEGINSPPNHRAPNHQTREAELGVAHALFFQAHFTMSLRKLRSPQGLFGGRAVAQDCTLSRFYFPQLAAGHVPTRVT